MTIDHTNNALLTCRACEGLLFLIASFLLAHGCMKLFVSP
jgi:hypothetical protein